LVAQGRRPVRPPSSARHCVRALSALYDNYAATRKATHSEQPPTQHRVEMLQHIYNSERLK